MVGELDRNLQICKGYQGMAAFSVWLDGEGAFGFLQRASKCSILRFCSSMRRASILPNRDSTPLCSAINPSSWLWTSQLLAVAIGRASLWHVAAPQHVFVDRAVRLGSGLLKRLSVQP